MFPSKWLFALFTLLATTVAALAAGISFDWCFGPASSFLIPFFLPVLTTALCFGVRWSLLAIVLNTLIIAYYFMPPQYSLAIETLENRVRIGSFATLSGIMLGLTGSLRYYRAKAETEARATQKNIAKAIQESDQKFRAVFHAQFQFIGLMSPEGVLLEANHTALAAAGVSEDEVIGKLFWDTAWWSHDPVQQQRLRDAVRKAANGQRDRFEASHPRSNGSLMWIDFSITPFYQDEKVVLLIPEGRDITERKIAEASVQESEQRFQSFMAHAPIAAWIVDAESRGVYTSPGFDRHLGLEPGAYIKRLPSDLWPSDIAAAYVENNRRVLADGSVVETEEPFVRLDGSTGAAHVVKFPMFGQQGEQLVGGVAVDITMHKNAELAMKANDALLRQFIKYSPAAIAMLDRNLHYIQASERWLSDYGLGGKDIVGMSHYELFPDLPDRWKEVHQRVLAGAIEGCEEDTFHRADGSIEWLQWECRPWHDGNGKIGGIIMFAQVITERKRVESELKLSEERFRRLVDGVANHAIFMLDTEGFILSWNPGAQLIKGYSAEEICGRHFAVFHTPDAVSTGHPQYELDIAKAEGRYQEEGLRVRKDGSRFWADVTISTLHDDAGRHVGFVKFTHDITERKESERRVRQSLKEKEVMLKEIHHRVKNNLQIVSALLELQSGFTSNQAILDMFEESQARVKSMALIHERLYKSGDFAGVNFEEYVRQLAEDLYRTYKVTNDEIEFQLDVNIPPFPIDIAIPCGLLLNELISNCLKHAFQDASKGRISVAMSTDNGNMVLSVSDDGAGFKPTVDFRNSASFGLQLVNTLVEQLNGKAEMLTSPGTKFTFRFPL